MKFIAFIFLLNSYLFAIIGINDIPDYMYYKNKAWKDKTLLKLMDDRISNKIPRSLYILASKEGAKQIYNGKLYIGTGYIGTNNSNTLIGILSPKRALLVYDTSYDIDCTNTENLDWSNPNEPPKCRCSLEALTSITENCLKFDYNTCSCVCDSLKNDYVKINNNYQCLLKCKEKEARDTSGKCIANSLSNHLKTPDYCKSYSGSYVIPYEHSLHIEQEIIGSELSLHYSNIYTKGFTNSDKNATKGLIAPGWDIDAHHRLSNNMLYKGNGEYLKDINISKENGNSIIKDKNLVYIFKDNKHIKTINQLSNVTLYEFIYNGKKLSSIKNTYSNTINLNYTSDKISSITTDSGQTTSIITDTDNTIKSIIYPNNQIHTFVYDKNNLMKKRYDSKNNEYRYSYRPNGFIGVTIRPDKGFMSYASFSDGTGNILSYLEDKKSVPTVYRNYLPKDGIKRSIVSYPQGSVKEVLINVDGKARKTKFCKVQTTEEYNAIHPKTNEPLLTKLTQIMPSGLTKNTTYQISFNNNQEIAQTTLSNDTTTITTNYSNHTKTIKSPLGKTHKLDYDAKMINVTRYTPPHTWAIHYNYDLKGNLTHKWQGFRHTYYSYDKYGNLISKRTNLFDTTKYTYDKSNRLTSIIYPDNSQIKYEYDTNNNIIRIYTPSSLLHTLSHNNIDKRDSWQNPQGYQTLYSYNTQQKPTKITKPSGKSLTFTYNKGELKSIYDGEHTSTINYTCENKPTSITSTSGEAIHYTYDGDLLISKSYKGVLNQNISFTYNNKFLPNYIEYANTKENITYDKDNRITTINNTKILYDKNNQTLKDNTFTSFMEIDNYAELKTIEDKINNKTIYKQEILQRDNEGRITKVKETTSKDSYIYTYTYNNKGQLTHSELKKQAKFIRVYKNNFPLLTLIPSQTIKEEFVHDKDGNQVSTKTTTDGQTTQTNSTFTNNSLETIGDTSYIYDNDGYLQTKITPQDTTYYTYSIQGELKKIQSNHKTIEYLHNINNQRVAKKVDGIIVEKYLWKDLTTLLAIYDKDDTLITRYFYANKQTPYKMTHKGKTYYLSYNHQGSLKTITNTNQTIVKEIIYNPYGKILKDTNSSLQININYAGGLYDKDTNLIKFGKRDYDPNTKRWTAKDPIDFSGGDFNLYRYVLNDPVNYVDREGEIAWFVAVPMVAGLTSYLNAPDIDEEPKSGMTPLSEATLSCVVGGGVGKNFNFYGSNKSRIFQLSYRKKPFFRLEKHNLNENITKIRGSGNQRTLHYHRGLTEESMNKHRPYQGGW